MDELTRELLRKIASLETRLNMIELVERGWIPKFLTAPLTSASWDGDAYSTTAKTKIDLSVVFGVPAGVHAVLIRVACRDSAGVANDGLFVGFAPNDTALEFALLAQPSGLPNDYYANEQGICPCDANGDIYYQIAASGAGNTDVILQIWGYWI